MIENLKKVKVNYNDTKTADVVLVSFLLNLTYFTLFSVFLLLTLNKQMFAVTILDQSSGNDDIAFFGEHAILQLVDQIHESFEDSKYT